jgi:hypothetical protein
MSRALSLAGFQVALIGRFWVTTEARESNVRFGIFEPNGRAAEPASMRYCIIYSLLDAKESGRRRLPLETDDRR